MRLLPYLVLLLSYAFTAGTTPSTDTTVPSRFNLGVELSPFLGFFLNQSAHFSIDGLLSRVAFDLKNDISSNECASSLVDALSSASRVATDLGSCLAAGFYCADLIESARNNWGVRLLDSWPRFEAGLASKGPFFFFGDYDQCSGLDSLPSVPGEGVGYCRLQVQGVLHRQHLIPIHLGLCLPASCVNFLQEQPNFTSMEKLSSLVGDQGIWSRVDGWSCHPVGHKAEERWAGARRNILFLVLPAVLLVIFGTIADYWQERKNAVYNVHMERIYLGTVYVDDRMGDEEEEVEVDDGGSVSSSTISHNGHRPPPSIALTYRSVVGIKRNLRRRKLLLEMLLSFSVRASLAHLYRPADKDISSLHALRILSALWVIVGHTALFTFLYTDKFEAMKEEMSKTTSLTATALISSPLAVDTFLFISGAVVAVTHRKRLLFRGSPHSSLPRRVGRWILFVLHRLFRVFPSVILVFIFTVFVFRDLGDGPMWDYEKGIFGSQCNNAADILPHLLFYSNYRPSFCLPWLWHISIDMQIQIFCPLLLIGLTHAPLRAAIGSAIAVAAIVGYRLFSVLIFGLHGDIVQSLMAESAVPHDEAIQRDFIWFYGNPLARAAPFIVGALTGWVVSVKSRKVLCPTFKVLLNGAWVSLLAYAFFPPSPSSTSWATAHSTLSTLSWSLGLAGLVYASENGHARALQTLVASPRILPMSRLAFGVYLGHEPILQLLVFTSRRPSSPHSLAHFVVLSATTLMLSLVAALLLAVSVEIPPQTMEKRLLKKRHRRTKIDHDEHRDDARDLTEAVSGMDKTAAWVASTSSSAPEWPLVLDPSNAIGGYSPVTDERNENSYEAESP